jgi:gentisate 1,2-dioxygenase
MTDMLITHDDGLPAEYSEALAAGSLGPLWTALHVLLPRERTSAAVPHRWRWRETRPLLLEAARLVPIEQAERRVLVLENPGLKGRYAITSTLYAGLQVILPRESAPSHRHTPAALRLVVEGRGAYTTVDGVRCVMEPGDLIITPPMHWHDHGHDGTEPVVWLDGLDIPLVRHLDASWSSAMQPARAPGTPSDPSADELCAAGVVPRRSRYPLGEYPMIRWPWRTVRGALTAMAARTPPTERVALRYTNPTTGASPLRTMGCEAAWLRAGETTRAERRTSGIVWHAIEGRGTTRIGDHVIDWEQGDTFVAPPWHWVEHAAGGAAPAALFSFDDEPVLRALGLYAEEGQG